MVWYCLVLGQIGLKKKLLRTAQAWAWVGALRISDLSGPPGVQFAVRSDSYLAVAISFKIRKATKLEINKVANDTWCQRGQVLMPNGWKGNLVANPKGVWPEGLASQDK
jgi:hypothetical protein